MRRGGRDRGGGRGGRGGLRGGRPSPGAKIGPGRLFGLSCLDFANLFARIDLSMTTEYILLGRLSLFVCVSLVMVFNDELY